MDRLFIFEDFSLIGEQQLKTVLERADAYILAKSLKGERGEILNLFLNCLPKRQAVMLEEDLEYMGPIRVTAVEEAQEQMIKLAFDVLAQDGKIVLSDGSVCENDFSLGSAGNKMEKFSFVDKEGRSYEFDFACVGMLGTDEMEKLFSYFSAEDIYVANRYANLALKYFITRRTRSCLEKKYITVDSSKVLSCQEKILKKMVELISSYEIKNPLGVEFYDLMALSDRDTQKVLREVEEETLVLAMKSASDDINDKIFKNVSKSAANRLKTEIQQLDCTELQIEEGRDRVVKIIERLEDSGEVIIIRDNIQNYII